MCGPRVQYPTETHKLPKHGAKCSGQPILWLSEPTKSQSPTSETQVTSQGGLCVVGIKTKLRIISTMTREYAGNYPEVVRLYITAWAKEPTPLFSLLFLLFVL